MESGLNGHPGPVVVRSVVGGPKSELEVAVVLPQSMVASIALETILIQFLAMISRVPMVSRIKLNILLYQWCTTQVLW